MTDQSREARLRALVEQWRESATWEIDQGSPEFGKGRDQCADELDALLSAVPPAFNKNGISFGERVVCIDVPGLFGTILYCGDDGVRVRWDDGTLGELIWDEAVAYDAYRLQVIRTAVPPAEQFGESKVSAEYPNQAAEKAHEPSGAKHPSTLQTAPVEQTREPEDI